MLSALPAGQPASITETFPSPAGFVGALVWDDTGSSPVAITDLPGMVNGVLPASNVSANMWRVKIPGVPGKTYLAQISAYTDGTYEVVDVEQPQADESFCFVSFGSGAGACGIVGVIESVVDIRC